MLRQMLAEKQENLVAYGITEAGINQMHAIHHERYRKAVSSRLDRGIEHFLGLRAEGESAEGVDFQPGARRRSARRPCTFQIAPKLYQVLFRTLPLAESLVPKALEAPREPGTEAFHFLGR